MAQFDLENHRLTGDGGALEVPESDEITRKLSMLMEGECEGLGPNRAAEKIDTPFRQIVAVLPATFWPTIWGKGPSTPFTVIA